MSAVEDTKDACLGEKEVGARVSEGEADVAESGAEEIVLASEGEYTQEQYKRLLHKIDWMLLPLMWLSYGLQQADKTATSTQATFGLKTDTHLVGQQYS
jgi:hypothetical protein